MAGEPTRDEVIAWLEATGEPAHAAIDRYWPRLFGKDRSRKLAQVRQWWYRHRNPGAAEPPPPELVVLPSPAPPPERPPGFGDEDAAAGQAERPSPDWGTADLARVDFLRGQLAELLADLAWARSLGLLGKIAPLDARVSDVRRDLDAALAEAGRTVKLDRRPAAVADELLRRHKRIAELAARAGGEA